MTVFNLKSLAASVAIGVASIGAVAILAPPSVAQGITVFDPGNYAQNLLTAARSLQQINNQIQSLQNEANLVAAADKNLKSIDFPELQQITQSLTKIDRLMGEAQGVDFRMNELDRQVSTLFPTQVDAAKKNNVRVIEARGRLDSAMAAFKQSMGIQSQIVENVHADASTLGALVARSQGAQGSLAAQQATNQLLALTAKQQFQIQNMMAAQYRAQSVEAARRAQAESDAKTATRKFLGTGSAYSPR